MDEVEEGAPESKGPSAARPLATVLAVLALTAGLGVSVASLDELDPEATPAAATVAPTSSPSPAPGDDEPDEPGEPGEPEEPGLVVKAGTATVYDSLDDVDDCATSRVDYPGPEGEAGFDDDVERVSDAIERVRRLTFEKPLDTHLVPQEEIGRRFARGIARSYKPLDAAAEARVLGALRLVPEGIDLRGLSLRLAEGTAAGFYHPRTKRLFARTTGGALTGYDEVVLAHELDHALVDQALRLPGTLSNDPMLGDVMLAHQALVEGDATLAMSQYGAGTLDKAALDSFMSRFSSPTIVGYPGVPYYLQRSSGFPYFEGFLFACRAWKEGGWKAIDRMYRKPPASTAEIVFPWRYRDRAAGELPPAPLAPGRRWTELDVASFGVFDLMLMLENADVLQGREGVAGSHVDEVRGWNGGVLSSWVRGDATAVHLSFLDAGVTEDGRRRRELCGVLRDWLTRTFPSAERLPGKPLTYALDGAYGGVHCNGASVQLAVGPERSTVRRLLGG